MSGNPEDLRRNQYQMSTLVCVCSPPKPPALLWPNIAYLFVAVHYLVFGCILVIGEHWSALVEIGGDSCVHLPHYLPPPAL